jgi:elongation factor Ts
VQITAAMVKDLRDKTGAGMMDCKKALAESEGDMSAANDYLRKKGLATAKKRAGRESKEGQVGSYIHAGGKIGVLVEINCETDFVGKTDEYSEFVKNIAMHIAAAAPMAVKKEDIDPALVEKEKVIYRDKALAEGKPEKVLDRIVEGQLKKFFSENCLLQQPYVKDTDMTIEDYLNQTIAKTGESMEIRRFARFALGEELD